MTRQEIWSSVRRSMVDRVDSAVLRRMELLADRASRGVGRQQDQVTAALSHGIDAMIGAGGNVASDGLRQSIVDQFHRLYYDAASQTWKNTRYRGVGAWKSPLDLWIYQELIHSVRPGLIVETGTALGGSGLYLADLCELNGAGRVVTIDNRERAGGVDHPRLTKVIASSSDPEVFAEVSALAPANEPVLVILDSDHSRDHVLAEMYLWSPLVTKGSYLVVEDTNINGHPVLPDFGPGPMEAVEAFLSGSDDFIVDNSLEKFLMSWNSGGFLQRISSP